MARSIIQTEKECYLCGTTQRLHEHHCIYGRGRRPLAEKYGLKVWLCVEHHVGQRGVHNNSDLSMQLKKLAQMKFEEVYGANKCFRDVFGINYLEEENEND